MNTLELESSARQSASLSAITGRNNLNRSANDRKRYVPENAFLRNLALQMEMTTKVMKYLRMCGVTAASELPLDFCFYTDAASKASSLAETLKEKGYSVSHGPSEDNAAVQIVTGSTEKMKMINSVVGAWTKEMCETAFAADCQFDGWGTWAE